MIKKSPLLSRFILFVLLPFSVLVAVAFNFLLLAPLPKTTGTAYISGISDRVTIERIGQQVTRIHGSSDNDVYFATGYAHAQDRMWQLEVQRRLSQGRLSEIFGESSLNRDIWMRTLGIYRSAETAVSSLSPEAKASLKAYADGINTWLNQNHSMPIEFSLFSVVPEPWTVADSLAWSKVFALNLGGNYQLELQRYLASQYLDHQQFTSLFPDLELDGLELDNIANHVAHQQQPLISAELWAFQQDINDSFLLGGRYAGSNAWVVSGQLTQSGNAILANDPHLNLGIPSLWYFVEQKGKALDVAGMTMVGLPVVVFGKNQHVAWGGTSMTADVQDVIFERLHPTDASLYQTTDGWKRFESRIETIAVRAEFPAFLRNPEPPVSINVRSSQHGPLISDTLNAIDTPVALSWVALSENDTSYEAFFRLSYVDDWESFNQALALHVAPALNLFYADTSNNIGLVAAGRIPLRESGNGSLPTEGSRAASVWQGMIPFSEMPKIYNPDTGYIVNANNANTPPDYPYFISQDWAPDHRARRIEQLLLEKTHSDSRLTMDDMVVIQSDVVDLSTEKLLPVLQSSAALKTAPEDIKKAFSEWQGEAQASSIAATIYYGWTRHIKSRLLEDELKSWGNKPQHNRHLSAIIGATTSDTTADFILEDSPLCNDIRSEKTETCQDILSLAFNDTIEELRKLAGNNIDNWQWGALQETVYRHVPMSEIKVFKNLFERRIPNSGAQNTINVATSSFEKSDGYEQHFGAGFRQIFELNSNNIGHKFMNSTGQSGLISSSGYDDMLQAFRDVTYPAIRPDEEHVETLDLIPAPEVVSAQSKDLDNETL